MSFQDEILEADAQCRLTGQDVVIRCQDFIDELQKRLTAAGLKLEESHEAAEVASALAMEVLGAGWRCWIMHGDREGEYHVKFLSNDF